MYEPKNLKEDIVKYFPQNLRLILSSLSDDIWKNICEIRVSGGLPLQICCLGYKKFVSDSVKTSLNDNAYIVTLEDMKKISEIVTKSSVYAYNRNINEGYITLPGGHRVGMIGECVMSNNEICTVHNISSFNFRICRDIKGCSDIAFSDIYCDKHIRNTLIISPPGCGKTTLLRSIAANMGNVKITSRIINYSIVDERYEIAAQCNGVSGMNVGMSASVISGCKKTVAIPIIVRSMSPEVIIADEIAGKNDFGAIEYAKGSGCSIIATVHGRNEYDNELSGCNIGHVFDVFIILSNKKGPGTIEKITSRSSLYDCKDDR